ncbi:MAG TPA: hypothetical protein V6C58_28025, partial [Allocoleopsis sp.]
NFMQNPTQIILEPEQYQTLAKMAERQSSNIDDVIKDVLRRGLQSMEEIKEKRILALDRLNKARLEYEQKYGVYQGDIIAEVREEREKEIDQARG